MAVTLPLLLQARELGRTASRRPTKIAALAGATLALGATYWLLRKRGDRAAETSEHDPSSSQ